MQKLWCKTKMKEIKDIANFRDLLQLESEPIMFYDQKKDTLIITRQHTKQESMEEFDMSKIVDVYIDKDITEWFIVMFESDRKDYIKTQKEILKELEE